MSLHAAPRPVLAPTRRRPARGCTGSSRSGPRCTRASASGNRTSTPENRKSVSDAIALPKLSVAATAAGASADVAGICDDDPMCMQTTVLGLLRTRRRTGPSRRSGCDGRPRCGGISLKHTARTPRAALRRTSAAASSASHSGMMHSGIRRPPRVAAPLLDHPVVVRVHARERELAVLGLEERLAAEAREGREAQRRLDVVERPCRRARAFGLVAAGAHLVVGDRRHRHVVAVEADRGDVALVRCRRGPRRPSSRPGGPSGSNVCSYVPPPTWRMRADARGARPAGPRSR